MPRRVAYYAPEFQGLNRLVSFSAFLLGLSTFIILYNMYITLRQGKEAGANPWRALTLEWATTSPPPATNFYGDPIPYEDPYGYGTDKANAYLDAIDKRFGVPDEVPVPRPAISATAPSTGD
jgi:cytochrome c oxidase subunit I